MTAAVTERSQAFVAAHRAEAEALGRGLALDLLDPEVFAIRLRTGLERLGDAEYRDGQKTIAPGLGPTFGVRVPLLAAVGRAFRTATRREPADPLLYVADRLFREESLEIRWLAFGMLERLVVGDPERSWQLLRQGAREASDWITVDTLAHPVGKGILAEPYRWAELEQLAYSPSRWERRLVGSTVATIPFIDHRAGRAHVVLEHGLGLVGDLIGDAEPDVMKALSWALRSLVLIDAEAVEGFAREQAGLARTASDGHRAWVIRDSLPKLDPSIAAELRECLAGIRRRPGAPSTSSAVQAARRFGRLPDPRSYERPPLDPAPSPWAGPAVDRYRPATDAGAVPVADGGAEPTTDAGREQATDAGLEPATANVHASNRRSGK